MQIGNVVAIVAGVFIVLAVVVGSVGLWQFYECYTPAIYAPLWKCLAILLVTIFWVVVFGGIGVVLSQVQR